MFQSPQMMYSERRRLSFFMCSVNESMQRYLACWRSSLDEPEGKYSDTMLMPPSCTSR